MMKIFEISSDELLSQREYERVRPDRIASIIRHKEPRRIPLGTCLTVLFESRQSVLHQMQEVLYTEGPSSNERIARTIAEYHHLLPGPRTLTATVFIDGGPAQVACQVGRALGSTPGAMRLHIGEESFEATCLDEPEHCTCPVRYVRFELSTAAAWRLPAHADCVVLALCCEKATAATTLAHSQRAALFENLKTNSVRHAARKISTERLLTTHTY